MNLYYIYLFVIQDDPDNRFSTFMGVFVVIGILAICSYYVSRYLETLYVKVYKKPLYIHLYPVVKQLPSSLQPFLMGSDFYNHLDPKRKRYFEHRVVRFLKEINFVGREELIVDDSMRMQIAMMFIQLTFGMRNYLLDYLNTIVLYPSSYYSILNKTENNGEFNPRSKAMVLSWEHFQQGNKHKNDGVNLGFHEITHVIHYSAIKGNDINSEIFYDTFLELEKHLQDKELQKRLVETKLVRSYAFTDKFEFVAVLVEVFMESPEELKFEFPVIYEYVSQMLNFKYFEK